MASFKEEIKFDNIVKDSNLKDIELECRARVHSLKIGTIVSIFDTAVSKFDEKYYRGLSLRLIIRLYTRALISTKGGTENNSGIAIMRITVSLDRKSTRLNSSHPSISRMPSSA